MRKLLVVAVLAIVGAGAAGVKMGYVPLPKKAEVAVAKAVTALPVTVSARGAGRLHRDGAGHRVARSARGNSGRAGDRRPARARSAGRRRRAREEGPGSGAARQRHARGATGAERCIAGAQHGGDRAGAEQHRPGRGTTVGGAQRFRARQAAEAVGLHRRQRDGPARGRGQEPRRRCWCRRATD